MGLARTFSDRMMRYAVGEASVTRQTEYFTSIRPVRARLCGADTFGRPYVAPVPFDTPPAPGPAPHQPRGLRGVAARIRALGDYQGPMVASDRR